MKKTNQLATGRAQPQQASQIGNLVALSVIVVAATAVIYSRWALSPVQEAMQAALAFSDNQMAILQGTAPAFGIIFGLIPLGFLIDRYSRVRLLLVFAAAELIGSMLLASTSHFAILFVARWLMGLAAGATLIAAFSLIADLFTPGQRGRAIVVLAVGSDVALSAAFAVGGVVLAAYGTTPHAWQWAILWTTTPPLLVTMLLVTRLREPARTEVVLKNPPVLTALKKLWAYRAAGIPLLVARVMVGVADGATIIWAAPLFSRRFNMPPDETGTTLATVVLVSGICAALTGGVLADFCHRLGGSRRTLLTMSILALCSIPAGLFGLAPDANSTSILLAVFLYLGFTANTAGAALSIVIIPSEIRGAFLSMSMVLGAIFGLAIAPVLVSSIAGILGGPSMIGNALAIVCVTAGAAAAVAFALGGRYSSRGATA